MFNENTVSLRAHQWRKQVASVSVALSLTLSITATARGEAATFRAGVGIILINDSGQVLALERCDIPGAWQLPQGGIDKAEVILDAAKRELREETHIDIKTKTIFLAEHPDWLAYQLPQPTEKHGLGQVQKWTLFLFLGNDADINIAATQPKEFCKFKWMTLHELANGTVWFRKGIYKQLAEYFSKYLAE